MAEDKADEVAPSPEIHFEPLVKNLPVIEVKSLEENEEEMFKMRAKLYRYDSSGGEAEWKERGTGEVKILQHKKNGTIRILMRRDKTFKICANHLITSEMELKPNCGSDRAWVYSTPADLTENEARAETLAIRFANSENANKFKDKITECQKLIISREDESDKLAKELEGLNVKEGESSKPEEESKVQEKEKSETNAESTDTSETKQETSEEPKENHTSEEAGKD